MDNQEEFLRLFLRYQGEVRAFIGSLVRDRHACEDVLQEVALVLWREFPRYDPARSFGAWARGVAAKKVMQRWSRDSRLPVPFSPQTIEAVLAAYDRGDATVFSRVDALHQCLEKLPEKVRRLLALRYEQSLKLAEIARSMQSTIDAVHKALSRTRSQLQACVERRLAIP